MLIDLTPKKLIINGAGKLLIHSKRSLKQFSFTAKKMHVHSKSAQPTKTQFCAIKATNTLQLKLAGHRTDPKARKCKT